MLQKNRTKENPPNARAACNKNVGPLYSKSSKENVMGALSYALRCHAI